MRTSLSLFVPKRFSFSAVKLPQKCLIYSRCYFHGRLGAEPIPTRTVRKGNKEEAARMPVSWDSFSSSSSSLAPIPENPPAFWDQGAAGRRTARLESSDCESLDSSLSSEADAQEYQDEVSLPDFDLLNDPEDELLCANLMKLIQVSLNKAKINANRASRLLMPSQLVAQVGKELLHLAYREPCGLRGALIDLCVEQGKGCHSVGQIAVDPSLVPTFQLTLVLRLDSRLWPKIQGLFSSGSAFSPGFSQSLKLSTGFRVIKKKLYSSEQLLIEEC